MNLTKILDCFIAEQVDSRTCTSVTEAEQIIKASLFKRELGAKIARAREDVKAGRVREANLENNAKFLAKLEKNYCLIKHR